MGTAALRARSFGLAVCRPQLVGVWCIYLFAHSHQFFLRQLGRCEFDAFGATFHRARKFPNIARMRQLLGLVHLPQRRVLARFIQHPQIHLAAGRFDGAVFFDHGLGAEPQNRGTRVLARGVFLSCLAVTGGGGSDLEMDAAKSGRFQCGLGGFRSAGRGMVDQRLMGFFLDGVRLHLGAHGVLHFDFAGGPASHSQRPV